MDDLEARGQWWLPGRPERKVSGILTFSLDGGAELSLLGSMRSLMEEGERSDEGGEVRVAITQASLERSGNYSRLHGIANGAAYTLEDCFRIRASNAIFPGEGLETIRVNRVLKGALFEEGEALEAMGISFGLTNLVDWIGETGISEQITWREDGLPLEDDPRFRLEIREKPDRHAEIAEGSLFLKHTVGLAGDHITERSVTQGFHWRVDQKSKVRMEDLIDLASDVQDLVTIAIDRTSAFEFVRFWHPDVFREVGQDKRHPEPIELFVQWNAQAKKPIRRIYEHDLLFTFEQLGGIQGVSRWMEAAARHRGGLGRVMGSRYAEGMFSSDRLLNCSAALEAFDRDSTGEKRTPLKIRLQRCSALAGDSFKDLVADVNRWAEVIRLERNDVAHHFGRRMRSSGSEAFYLWQSLYWLYAMCMLRDSSAPEAVFNHLRQNRRYDWLANRIREVIQ